MGDNNDVDILRPVTHSGEPRCSLPRRKSFAELFIFARQCAVARIEQYELLAGVHERRNIRMLEALGIDVIRPREGLHCFGRGIAAVMWMQAVSDGLGIQDGGDLKVTQLETIYCRLQFALE